MPPTGSATAAASDPEQLYTRVSPAVVTITNRQRQGRSNAPTLANVGSGVIYDTRGDIITNRHIIDGAQTIDVGLQSGKTVPGVLIGQDPVADLAVVRIAAGDAPGVATLGDSAQVRPGQHVIAIGNPQGFAGSVSHGIVSGTDRVVGSLEGMIQTDAAISPGNSGGPLVNANGEVIGIVTNVVLGDEKAEKLAFAIPSNLAKRLADTLVADGKVTRPYIGIATELLTPARAEELGVKAMHGAYVSDVTQGTPATKAGLAKGDVIVRVGPTVIDRPTPLSIVLLDYKPGDTVTLTINRGGTEQPVSVTFVERPAALDP
jgi:2-alkenal reductase